MSVEDSVDTATNTCRYARVFLLDAAYAIDRPFDYFIPLPIRESVKVGMLALVPFGGGNRRQYAVITELHDDIEPAWENRIKPIDSLLFEDFSLNSELLRLSAFLREYTLCTMGEAVRCLLPPAAFGQIREKIILTEKKPTGKTESRGSMLVWNCLEQYGSMMRTKLQSQFGDQTDTYLRELERNGLIRREIEYREPQTKQSELYECSLTEEQLQEIPSSKNGITPKQRQILLCAIQTPGISREDLLTAASVTMAPVKLLLQKGYLVCRREQEYRDPYENVPKSTTDNTCLTELQEAAYQTLLALSQAGEAKAALLYGVTGSGKTRVLKALMDSVIDSGRQVIFLVPEIALTPQTVGFFRSCYGDRVAVIHSGLSAGERLDTYTRIKHGQVDICIGTRSAVFAPFDKLGLIILDEEQEHTYKSDSAPRYHARDVARFRCGFHNAMMVLASATPSVESYYKAQQGNYTLVTLTQRYGNAGLPKTEIVDMRDEEQKGNVSPFGSRLLTEINENLKNNEQTILFLSRRGYHNFLSCPKCGAAVLCPHCSVSLTYHSARVGTQGYLTCHYCGLRQEVPKQCPTCGEAHLHFVGYGTQKGEESLKEQFPDARIARMDADTTTSKWSYFDILQRFRSHESDILLGTQMVVKGHDFPDVTLAAVANADTALFLDDYRANERTFSMLAQLLGRAGRAEKSGRALIQTYNPEHPVILQGAAQDYDSFYQNEIKLRHALLFPPFCDIVLISLAADDEKTVMAASKALDAFIGERQAKDYRDVTLQCFGPFEAPIYKMNEKYRMRMVIKCRNNKRSRQLFRSILNEFAQDLIRHLTVTVDINPSHL